MNYVIDRVLLIWGLRWLFVAPDVQIWTPEGQFEASNNQLLGSTSRLFSLIANLGPWGQSGASDGQFGASSNPGAGIVLQWQIWGL